MDILLTILAAFGIVAVLWRLLRAVLRALQRGTDAFLAREIADVRANRGDLTGVDDARVARERLRAGRSRALVFVLLYLVLLIAPSLTAMPMPLYAACNLLWLLPPAWRGRR